MPVPVNLHATPARAMGANSWRPVLVCFALLAVLYLPVLAGMVREWATVEEMGHGFFVPVVAGYIVWKDREQLLKLELKPSWWGLALVLWGFLQLVLGTAGADFFVARTAFFASLVGVLWTCCGTAVVARLAFPLFLLLFMIRLPLFVYSQITFPLQILASRLAEFALGLLNIPVVRDGNVLELASQRLSVVEACSGIRSLISLGFLSLVYAYFLDRKVWMRGALFAVTIPIAILANASRITVTGVLSEYKRELAEGFYHTFEGWIVFMVALGALMAVHRLLNLAYSLAYGRK